MHALYRHDTIASDQSTWPKCPVCGVKQPRGGFVCPRCPSSEKVSFSYQIQLMVHLTDFHNIQMPVVLPCEVCSERFSSSDELLQHILVEEHSCSSEHLTCTCDVMFQFDTEENLLKHQKVHHAVAPSQNIGGVNNRIVTMPSHVATTNEYLPASLTVTGVALPRIPATSPLQNPFSSLLTPHYNSLQSQPLFHLNVNTNFYPYNNLVANRFSMPTAGVALNEIQQTASKTIIALHNQQMQRSSMLTLAAQSGGGTSELAIDITNTAAKILLSKNEVCVKSLRKCAFCESEFEFKQLTDLVSCDVCPKSFMNSDELMYHRAERHDQKLAPHLLSSSVCPADNCEYSVADPSFTANFIQHWKTVHTNEKCLYHYVCHRASCRQVFGSLVGTNAHDLFCKENVSKMLEKKYQITCWTCSQLFYPCSIAKCSDCDILFGNEKELLEHRAIKHNNIVDPPCQSSVQKVTCKAHYICSNKLCRIITSNYSAYEMHRKECVLGPLVQTSPSVSSSKSVMNASDVSITPESTQQRINQMRKALQQNQVIKTAKQPTDQQPAYRVHVEKSTSRDVTVQSSAIVSKTIKRESASSEDTGNVSRKRSRFHDSNEEYCKESESVDTSTLESQVAQACADESVTLETLDEELESSAVKKAQYEPIYESGEIENEEHLALIENPASSSAWDDVMDSLLAYTDSIDA